MPLYYKIPLTGVILAGGKSSRMKVTKCLISFNGKRLIDIIVSKVRDIFEEIYIVTNFPDLYFYTGISLLGDIYPFKGPMAGIHVALRNSKYDIFAFACDMPFIKKEVIFELFERHIEQNSSITVPLYQNKIYPLPGIYSKNLLKEIEYLLKQDKLSMIKLLHDSHAQLIDIAKFDEEGLSFININTEEDLKILTKGGIKCLG